LKTKNQHSNTPSHSTPGYWTDGPNTGSAVVGVHAALKNPANTIVWERNVHCDLREKQWEQKIGRRVGLFFPESMGGGMPSKPPNFSAIPPSRERVPPPPSEPITTSCPPHPRQISAMRNANLKQISAWLLQVLWMVGRQQTRGSETKSY